MQAFAVLLLVPCLVGLAARASFRETPHALLFATFVAPLAVYACIGYLDADDGWNWLAGLMVAPLAVAVALSAALIGWHRRRRPRHVLDG